MTIRQQHGPVAFYGFRRPFARRTLRVGVFAVDGLLVDTGPRTACGDVAEIVERENIRQVVVTHHHEDHSGNAALVARASGAPPMAHESAIEQLARPSPLRWYRRLAWGSPEPCEAIPVGDEIRTDRFRFRVIPTPGHAPDHISLYEAEQRWLFTGDLFVDARRRVLFVEEDVTHTLASLRRLMELPDCAMFCQHVGHRASHQKHLGQRLDYLLGMRNQAVILFEEGCNPREITRELHLRHRFCRWISRGELSGRNLVVGLLRDAGKVT